MFGRGSWIRGRRALAATLGPLALMLAFAGCGTSAEWKNVEIASSYQPLRAVTFRVTASAPGADMADFEMAIVTAFAKWDIHATPLDEESAQPNLRVTIERWAPGSDDARRGLAVAAGVAAGVPTAGAVLAEGEILVDVRLVGEKGEVVIQGKVRGLVDHDADDAVHEIADVIAFTVVKGEAGQQAPTSKPHTTYP